MIQRARKRSWRVAAAIVLAAVIFWIDSLTPVPGAVSVLYVGVILLVADVVDSRWSLATGVATAALAITGYLMTHAGKPLDASFLRLLAGLVAITIATILVLRNWSTKSELVEHAELLELAHETVVIRGLAGDIRYWNAGAEQLYGYSREQALGATYAELLRTRLPMPEAEIHAVLKRDGRWNGELERIRSDGGRIILDAQWSLRADKRTGQTEIVEICTDITEQRRADAAAAAAERRYRRIFETAGVAILEEDWSDVHALLETLEAEHGPRLAAALSEDDGLMRRLIAQVHVLEVNEAAVALFEAESKAELTGRAWADRFTPATELGQMRATLALYRNRPDVLTEIEYRTLAGNSIEVLVRITASSENRPWDRVLISAIDVTERNRIQRRLDQTLAELAHASRVTTLGVLAASITHEVNQPLSAIATYARSGKRWLERDKPDLAEAVDCLDHVLLNSDRAIETVKRVRSLSRKADIETGPVSLPDLIAEALVLVRRELLAGEVEIEDRVAQGLPDVLGDRIQIQQVVMNLLLNAIQAMQDVHHEKRICIEAFAHADDMVRVEISDCGTGIAAEDPNSIFAPFFTTKSSGTGVGLSICRSIIESHSGKMDASNCPDGGARIGFTLPAAPAMAEVAE